MKTRRYFGCRPQTVQFRRREGKMFLEEKLARRKQSSLEWPEGTEKRVCVDTVNDSHKKTGGKTV